MAVSKVNDGLLRDLTAMGFSVTRATKALHYSGNTSLEEAVNWIVDHEDDPNIEHEMEVSIDINIDSDEPFHFTAEMKRKALELKNRARIIREEEEKRSEREREKARIRSGKELVEAKQIAEENERKCYLALKQSEKEEEKREREYIRRKVEEDKSETRSETSMKTTKIPEPAKISIPIVHEKVESKPVVTKLAPKADLLRECLRSIKRNHMDDEAKVKQAFQTLLIYIGNVLRIPNEEKFRKIRITNPLFQETVGSLKGGVEFLELCGFERTQGGDFLYLHRKNADVAVLKSAGSELKSAITNPFFGMLSRKKDAVF